MDSQGECWPKSESEAADFLVDQGFEYTNRLDWIRPAPDHKLTVKGQAAVSYLMEEWEWGQVVR
jgi:hypothetical protein